MSIKIDGDKIIFPSGKVAYANNGIIGLSPELEISQGYDGGLRYERIFRPGVEFPDDDISPDDLRELARFMIVQWQRFLLSIPIDQSPP